MEGRRGPHPWKPSPAGPWLPAPRHRDPHYPLCGWHPGGHSPSSSCLRASFVGSRLRGRSWHLASRILKRAFCLMGVVGAPGESQSPPRWWPLLWVGWWWGPGTAEGMPECEGAARGTSPPGAGAGGTSAASFLSLQGLKKVKVWMVGSSSSQVACASRRGGRREGSKEGKGHRDSIDAQTTDSFEEPITALGLKNPTITGA